MKLLVPLLVMFLTACSTTVVPITKKFPELPPMLREECEDLVKLDGNSVIDLLKTNVENYERGVDCRVRHNAFLQWYREQERLFRK